MASPRAFMSIQFCGDQTAATYRQAAAACPAATLVLPFHCCCRPPKPTLAPLLPRCDAVCGRGGVRCAERAAVPAQGVPGEAGGSSCAAGLPPGAVQCSMAAGVLADTHPTRPAHTPHAPCTSHLLRSSSPTLSCCPCTSHAPCTAHTPCTSAAPPGLRASCDIYLVRDCPARSSCCSASTTRWPRSRTTRA